MYKLFDRAKKGPCSGERGELMIESMIVVIITMFVLIWLLGLGFLYYQRYVAVVTTNDVAVKIASTYNNPTSDVIMGYVTTEDLSGRNLYRNFTAGNLRDINEQRAEAYVKYRLDQMDFTGAVDTVDVKLELVRDSAVRKHVKIITECTLNTPFGSAFKILGMEPKQTYTLTACADCTDVADYISTVDFSQTPVFTGGKFVNSIVSLVNKMIGFYNTIVS